METWWLWNCFLQVNGKEEPWPCVRMTVMTRPQGSPQVSPCPQVSQLESHSYPFLLWSVYFASPQQSRNFAIINIQYQLFSYIISFPSLQVYFVLISTQICCNISHLKTKTKPPWAPHPLQLPPFSLLQFVARLSETCILSASSLPIFSQRHYIQVRSPRPVPPP